MGFAFSTPSGRTVRSAPCPVLPNSGGRPTVKPLDKPAEPATETLQR